MENQVLGLVRDVIVAAINSNRAPSSDICSLMREVYETFVSLDKGASPEEKRKPAVQIGKSVTPEFIVCLEDGKRLKMLKRYLRSRYNLSPEEYRARWGLKPDYPMVAPNYAKQRSEFAKSIGLGKASGNPRRSRANLRNRNSSTRTSG